MSTITINRGRDIAERATWTFIQCGAAATVVGWLADRSEQGIVWALAAAMGAAILSVVKAALAQRYGDGTASTATVITTTDDADQTTTVGVDEPVIIDDPDTTDAAAESGHDSDAEAA